MREKSSPPKFPPFSFRNKDYQKLCLFVFYWKVCRSFLWWCFFPAEAGLRKGSCLPPPKRPAAPTYWWCCTLPRHYSCYKHLLLLVCSHHVVMSDASQGLLGPRWPQWGQTLCGSRWSCVPSCSRSRYHYSKCKLSMAALMWPSC